MNERRGEPSDPLLDPVELPPAGGRGALDWISGLKAQPARFGCLGLGCLPWTGILLLALLVWLLLR